MIGVVISQYSPERGAGDHYEGNAILGLVATIAATFLSSIAGLLLWLVASNHCNAWLYKRGIFRKRSQGSVEFIMDQEYSVWNDCYPFSSMWAGSCRGSGGAWGNVPLQRPNHFFRNKSGIMICNPDMWTLFTSAIMNRLLEAFSSQWCLSMRITF